MNENPPLDREPWLENAIAQELTEMADLLPPWIKYPDIPRFSIGWRMGSGEFYMMVWQEWSSRFDEEQLLTYFTRHALIPVDWLDWVSFFFGFDDDLFAQEPAFPGILWLEEHHLANLAEFKIWHSKLMRGDLEIE